MVSPYGKHGASARLAQHGAEVSVSDTAHDPAWQAVMSILQEIVGKPIPVTFSSGAGHHYDPPAAVCEAMDKAGCQTSLPCIDRDIRLRREPALPRWRPASLDLPGWRHASNGCNPAPSPTTGQIAVRKSSAMRLRAGAKTRVTALRHGLHPASVDGQIWIPLPPDYDPYKIINFQKDREPPPPASSSLSVPDWGVPITPLHEGWGNFSRAA